MTAVCSAWYLTMGYLVVGGNRPPCRALELHTYSLIILYKRIRCAEVHGGLQVHTQL